MCPTPMGRPIVAWGSQVGGATLPSARRSLEPSPCAPSPALSVRRCFSTAQRPSELPWSFSQTPFQQQSQAV